jgi:hypothetical protein
VMVKKQLQPLPLSTVRCSITADNGLLSRPLMCGLVDDTVLSVIVEEIYESVG